MDYVLGFARGRHVLVDGAASPAYDGPTDVPGELTHFSFWPWPPRRLQRPVYRGARLGRVPAGLALDDGAAARFDGTELVEVVVTDPASSGCRVGPDGEEPLEARLLPGSGLRPRDRDA